MKFKALLAPGTAEERVTDQTPRMEFRLHISSVGNVQLQTRLEDSDTGTWWNVCTLKAASGQLYRNMGLTKGLVGPGLDLEACGRVGLQE